MRITDEFEVHLAHVLAEHTSAVIISKIPRKARTVAFRTPLVDARTCHKDIMHHGETAFTAYPLPISRENSGIMQDSCFVEQHAAVVDRLGKRDLFRVEVVKA